MPKKAKHKSRRGERKNRHLTNSERLEIVKCRDMGMTINETANKVQCAYQTVEHTMKNWVPKNADRVRDARVASLEELAITMQKKANLAVACITEDSLTHDRIVTRDEDGNIIAAVHSGPTGMQIATVAGIMTDKVMKLRDKADSIRESQNPDRAITLDSISELVESIRGKAEKLSVNIEIDGITEKLAAAGVDLQQAAVEAQFTEIDDEESEGGTGG